MVDVKLTPRECDILSQLQDLEILSQKLTQKLNLAYEQLNQSENAKTQMLRQINELKEENQHQREMLQSWRRRLETALSQLSSLD